MTDQLFDDQTLVRELEAIDGGLSAWEVEFIESISHQVETRPLSERQRAKADDILERLG